MDEKRWLIVTDLDGTALQDHTSLNPTTVKVLKEARKKGHVVCIATGRPPRAAIEFYKELELDTIMANYNGSILVNPADKTFGQMNFMLNKELVEEIVHNDDIMKHVDHWMVEREDFISTNQKEGVLFGYFHVGEVDELVKDANDLDCTSDKNSIIMSIPDKDNFLKVKEILSAYHASIVIRPWSLSKENTNIIEINSRRGNKGNALKIMAEYYNIPLNRTIAFGDMPNDLEMIEVSGVGIAMGNASEDLKKFANIILPKTNKEDAIADWLKDNLGI